MTKPTRMRIMGRITNHRNSMRKRRPLKSAMTPRTSRASPRQEVRFKSAPP